MWNIYCDESIEYVPCLMPMETLVQQNEPNCMFMQLFLLDDCLTLISCKIRDQASGNGFKHTWCEWTSKKSSSKKICMIKQPSSKINVKQWMQWKRSSSMNEDALLLDVWRTLNDHPATIVNHQAVETKHKCMCMSRIRTARFSLSQVNWCF